MDLETQKKDIGRDGWPVETKNRLRVSGQKHRKCFFFNTLQDLKNRVEPDHFFTICPGTRQALAGKYFFPSNFLRTSKTTRFGWLFFASFAAIWTGYFLPGSAMSKGGLSMTWGHKQGQGNKHNKLTAKTNMRSLFYLRTKKSA
ncbi:hypothetical protein LJC59_02280 [Desulfovibrio sp. OttesenSCG-928-A18]|nr:hypothetical protein [Desulfovibrio sp. OttesenSCG-928-A18]